MAVLHASTKQIKKRNEIDEILSLENVLKDIFWRGDLLLSFHKI